MQLREPSNTVYLSTEQNTQLVFQHHIASVACWATRSAPSDGFMKSLQTRRMRTWRGAIKTRLGQLCFWSSLDSR